MLGCLTKSTHREDYLFIYEIYAILSPWAYEENNDLYSLFFRQKYLVALLKRKIQLTHTYA